MTTMMNNEAIKLTNVWTVYRLNPDGSEAEQGFAELSRPQDWGNSDKWLYKTYTLHAEIKGQKYINEAHCWAEKPIEEHKHLEMFSGLIATILMPGTPVELCSNTHLSEDDFWNSKWGKLPPYFDGDDGDDDE